MLSISLPSLNSPFTQSTHETCPSPLRLSPRNINFRRSTTCAAAAAATATYTAFETASCSSFYDILGIPIAASSGEIKAAYRRLARSCHPDVAGSGDSSAVFVRVNDAYTTLSDPEKRKDYDRSLVIRPPMNAGRFYGVSSPPSSTTTSFSRSPRKNWESDQCW